MLLSGVAVMFVREGGRSAGITAKRLLFAATGTGALAGMLALAGLVGPWPGLGRLTNNATRLLTAGLLICVYVAFSTPRRLWTRWLRSEEARYLSTTAQLDAEERGRRAAADLTDAAARSASNAVTLVALRPTPEAQELIVRASTRAKLLDVKIPKQADALTRVLRDGPTTMAAAACDPPLGPLLTEYGSRVLAAPISTASHTWGALLVVQRRGSLFPEDDLRLLTRLGSFAATALDHAQLVADARRVNGAPPTGDSGKSSRG